MKDLLSLEAPSISLVWENYLGWTLTCHFWAYGLVLDLLFASAFQQAQNFRYSALDGKNSVSRSLSHQPGTGA